MPRTLITGGAGFIGCNIAERLLRGGNEVVIFDNFSRRGTDKNAAWLSGLGGKLKIIKGDVRNYSQVKDAAKGADAVYHLAAQVAVTTSVTNPREDFEVNAAGTFNALEAARASGLDPVFVYSSTNKVYGGMESVKIAEKNNRYSYATLANGVGEDMPLDFHSPYGCSKGCGDQYVRDYSRIYGLKSVVFRQSCIYGKRQFGIEDQGWVAWFAIASVLGKPLTIYGDGKQVRDVLYAEDLAALFETATSKIARAKGEVFNIGGGPQNTLSLLELIKYLEEMLGKKIKYSFADWRPGDQKVYISDISKAEKVLGWKPKTGVKQGVSQLVGWARENKSLFS